MEDMKICSSGHGSHIPDDIIFVNILSRVPVKSLCRWKGVSRPWRNFIEDPVLIDRTRPKTPPLWLRKQKSPLEVAMVHIYSIDNNGAATIVQNYAPPPNPLDVKLYNCRLICCYHGSLQLTVFNALTQESVNISLPNIQTHAWRRFEYGYDPLSKKFKVLTYRYSNSNILPTDFEVLTLEEENPTWRSIKKLFRPRCLSDWAVTVDGTIFWYEGFAYEYCDIISFNFAIEEFGIIKLPRQNHKYFRRPLFEFEGSLCYAEIAGPVKEGRFNVWTLKDNNVLVPMVQNIPLYPSGTDLQTCRYGYIFQAAEFCAQNGELLIVTHDDKCQYVFSYNFLSCQCKRI